MLLAGLVAGGVGLVVALTHYTGGSTPTALGSTEEARSRYLSDFPHAAIEAIVLTDSGSAALLRLVGGGLGLVVVLGHHAFTRQLSPDQPRQLHTTGNGLQLRLVDFGVPPLRLTITDPDQRERWRRWLEA